MTFRTMLTVLLLLTLSTFPAFATCIHRSRSVARAFQRQTGYPQGRPGYTIDHVIPLACGSKDVASNLQWQTSADAKAKDKVERLECVKGKVQP